MRSWISVAKRSETYSIILGTYHRIEIDYFGTTSVCFWFLLGLDEPETKSYFGISLNEIECSLLSR